MRRLSGIISAVLAAVTVFAVCGRTKIIADNQMTAQQQVEAISIGWNLGNTLDSYGTWIYDVNPYNVETAWGNPVTTRQMIAAVRERGFNTIRIPVTWAQFIDGSGNVDSGWMSRVREVVDWSLDEGLYVILNVHHDTGEHGSDKVCWMIADMSSYESVRDRFAGLWTSIANEFKDYDNRLMFEGYNELLDSNNTWNAPSAGNTAYDAVNSFAQLFVDTVRATGGNNLTRNLIVNTYVASADQQVLDSFVLPDDPAEDHLICEIHAYTPWNFCSHDGDPSYVTFDGNCQSQIDDLMSSLSSFSERLGVPVIIGEFGVENQNNDSDRVSYVSYYVQKASQYGIRCIWWDNGLSDYGGYGILDRNALTWNESIASALIDNAPSGADYEVQAEETEVTVTEAAAAESTAEETTAVMETSEASEPSETAAETTVSAEDNSQSVNGNSSVITILLVIGGVAVASSYVGLFMLGRKMGKNKRER